MRIGAVGVRRSVPIGSSVSYLLPGIPCQGPEKTACHKSFGERDLWYLSLGQLACQEIHATSSCVRTDILSLEVAAMDHTQHVLVQAHELVQQLDSSCKAIRKLGVGVLFPSTKERSGSYIRCWVEIERLVEVGDELASLFGFRGPD